VIVYDVAAAKVRHKFPHPARLVAFSPDGKSLLSANAWVQRWDLTTGKAMYPEPPATGSNEPVPRLHWSGDGRRLLSCSPAPGPAAVADDSFKGVLTLWDVAPMAVIWRTTVSVPLLAVTLDRAGGVVRACTWNGRLMTWTVGSAVGPTEVPLPNPPDTFIVNARAGFLADGRLTVLWHGAAHLYPTTYDVAGRPIGQHTLPANQQTRRYGPMPPPGPPNGLVYADGRRFNAVTGRGRPPLWERWGTEEAHDVADVPLLVTAPGPVARQGRDVPMATVRDVETGRALCQLRTEYLGPVSPDGRWVAAPAGSGVALLDLNKLLGPGPGPEVRYHGTEKVTAVAFAPDARRLAAAQADGTITIWEVPAPAAGPWVAAAADRLWADLAADEPKAAWLALWHLLDHPAEATALLRARLRPVPAVKDVPGLIEKLDHPRYAVREAASKALAEHGDLVEGDLHRALAGKVSAEQRERLEGLVKLLDPTLPPTGNTLRGLRCVWLLDRIGTPEAKKVLAELATGAAGSRVTAEAKGALR
jgi:WD40 repeat protein